MRSADREAHAVLERDVTQGDVAADFTDSLVLSDEEYRAAMESTLTAFYTPPVVIKAMYEALDRLGFSKGNILEPSCGVGNFLGLLPDSMADSRLYGVEIDPLSGKIARQD